MFAESEVAECRCHLTSKFNRFNSADFIPQYDEGEFDIGFFLLDFVHRWLWFISSTHLRKYRFPLHRTMILSSNTNLCLWRADGEWRHPTKAKYSPNKQNDPCPNLKVKGRGGEHKFASSCWINWTQLRPQSTHPLPPSFFLWGNHSIYRSWK